MALKPLEAGKKNRILRNIGIMFLTQDINSLDKYGYGFLSNASGFIAHYNLGGFIDNYGDTHELAEDILAYKSSNQWDNFSKGERDYEYMMQKKEIYNEICKFAKGNFDNIPAEEDLFKPPTVKSLFEEEPEWRKTIEQEYSKHLAYGNYFNASDPQRIVDLADATMAYNNQVVQSFGEDKVHDHEFINSEITFNSGNVGTICQLLDMYRDEIWGLFNSLSDRNFELGIEIDEDEDDEDE
jgi:hypothetical protein